MSTSSGSDDGEDSMWASVWICAVWAAGTHEEGGAMCVGAGPRLAGQSLSEVVMDVETVLGGSLVEMLAET